MESSSVRRTFVELLVPALTISRPQIVNGMPPNLLAHYPYLWEPTVARQAIETAWTSVPSGRTFVEVLVPAALVPRVGNP